MWRRNEKKDVEEKKVRVTVYKDRSGEDDEKKKCFVYSCEESSAIRLSVHTVYIYLSLSLSFSSIVSLSGLNTPAQIYSTPSLTKFTGYGHGKHAYERQRCEERKYTHPIYFSLNLVYAFLLRL